MRYISELDFNRIINKLQQNTSWQLADIENLGELLFKEIPQSPSPYAAPGIDKKIEPLDPDNAHWSYGRVTRKLNEVIDKVNSGGLMVSEEELSRRVIEFIKPTQEEMFMDFLEKSRKEGIEKTFNELGKPMPIEEITRESYFVGLVGLKNKVNELIKAFNQLTK